MMKTIIATILASAASLGFEPTQQPGTRQGAIDDPEAYAVYASLIPAEWTVRVARAKRLVVARETATYNQCLPSGGPLETEWRPVVDSYKAANAATRSILPDRDLGHPYVVVPKSEIARLFKEPRDASFGWTTFYDRYPDSGGYMEFSAVGFDPSKTRALVYVAHHCGSLCGGGAHHLLQKVDGRWTPARLEGVTQCVWVS